MLTQVKQQNKPKSYIRWTENDRYVIGKYSSEHGTAATVRKFKKKFPKIKESTVREFKKRYENQIREEKKKKREPVKSLQKYQSKTGRPLLLGNVDATVQNYILAMSNRGAMITWSIANSAAKALIKKHPGIVGDIDVE